MNMEKINGTERAKFHVWIQTGMEYFLAENVSVKKRLKLEKKNKIVDILFLLLENGNLQDKFNECLKEDRVTNRIYNTSIAPVETVLSAMKF